MLMTGNEFDGRAISVAVRELAPNADKVKKQPVKMVEQPTKMAEQPAKMAEQPARTTAVRATEKSVNSPVEQPAQTRVPENDDAAVMTILNSTRRKVAAMERNMTSDQGSAMDRDTLLNTVTQLSVRANDTNVSEDKRRELRSQINEIISDVGMMSLPREVGKALVEGATSNMLEDAKATMKAQANQMNEDALSLLF